MPLRAERQCDKFALMTKEILSSISITVSQDSLLPKLLSDKFSY